MSQLTRNERQERGGSVRRKNKFSCVPWRRRQIDYNIPHHTELGIGVVHGGGTYHLDITANLKTYS